MNLKFRIVNDKGKLFFHYKNKLLQIAPDSFHQLNFSPTTQGFDKFIESYVNDLKKEFFIEIQDEWFFFCDACLIFDSSFLDGWLYKIKSEKVKIHHTHVWFCSYANLIFDKPPKLLYFKVS